MIPWKAIKIEEGLFHILRVNCTKTTVPIAILDHSRDGHKETRTITTPANARLIAAAPELYDGCNALLGLLQLLTGRDDLPKWVNEIMQDNHRIIEAKQAIAKVKEDE